ncbi:MAG: hypothetical protein PHD86_01530 [Kiritimatiellae bacterium]|nr:hypothetical protein [Kiritimatiellia bacterium]
MKNAQWLIVFTVLSLAAMMCGCDIESAESSQNEVGINVEGFYANSGGRLVQQNTGNPITSMNLRQNGDGLEGVDNNGNLFKGTIGQVIEGGTASFNLTGLTTAGNEGTISGNFTVSGTSSTMSGTWIENAFYSTVYGTATVPNNTNDTGGVTYRLTVNVSPAGTGTVSPGTGNYAAGSTVALTATAATGHTFSSWSGVSSSSGNSATVTMNGDRTVTANFN